MASPIPRYLFDVRKVANLTSVDCGGVVDVVSDCGGVNSEDISSSTLEFMVFREMSTPRSSSSTSSDEIPGQSVVSSMLFKSSLFIVGAIYLLFLTNWDGMIAIHMKNNPTNKEPTTTPAFAPLVNMTVV
jgi:hypothetical protein